MKILIIDTASKLLSLALVDRDVCMASHKEKEPQSHAKKITVEIDRILQEAGVNKKDLSAIALHRGPGSFTGLRVGSSVAKGICYALNIPLIALNGMEEYAQYIYRENQEKYTDIFLLEDARRENFFYSHISLGKTKISAGFAHITDIETEIYLSRSPLIIFTDKTDIIDLRAEFLAKAAFFEYQNQKFANLTDFEPLYLLNNYQKTR